MRIAYEGEKILLGKAKITPFSLLEISGKKIDWAGEYQLDGFSVRVFDREENGLAFRVSVNGVRIFFPAKKPFSEEDLDFDVLVISAENSYFSPKEWKNFVEESEPRIVIFSGNGEKTSATKKEMGILAPESAENLDLDAKKFTAENTLFFAFS